LSGYMSVGTRKPRGPAVEEALAVRSCDRTRIKPEYRGHKLELLIKAMSISALGRGCGVAVTYPALFEGGYDHAEDSRAIAALGAHWAELGFEHFRSGVWVLDLGARTFRTGWTIW
jgi:hypothetical protein